MKTCPICALDLEDAYLFCPDDGSSLQSLPGNSVESKSVSVSESVGDTAGAVVLYCPACAAEYPLTFSTCPVHGMSLTKHRIPKPSSSEPAADESSVNTPATVAGLRFRRDQSRLSKQLTTLDLRRPEIEKPNPVMASESTEIDSELVQKGRISGVDSLPDDPVAGGITAFDYRESLSDSHDSHERRLERPGFRVAAIATVVALAVFGLVAAYTLVSNFSRKSHSSPVQIASGQNSPQPRVVVPTPLAARDYQEEAPTITSAPSPERQADRPVDRARNEDKTSPVPRDGVQKSAVAQAPQRVPVATTPATPIAATRVSNPPMPALPRGSAGGFDARLIRVRSRQTSAGFRYDLTFNMQEQAGRASNWQRVLISTRSASGTSHSEAIPFSHRLGATGALTFTISVELTGRSESDWQGRVVCTALGWDNKGTPLQASFGANVAP